MRTIWRTSIITVFIFAICLVVVAVFWWKVPWFRARIHMTIAPPAVSESDVYELAKMDISSDAVIGLLWRNPQMGVALIRSRDWQERDIRKMWERVQKTTERPDGDLIPCAELIYEIRGARPDIFDNDAMSEIRRKLYLAFFHWSRNAQEENAILYYAGISLGIVEPQRTIATLDSQTQSKVIQKINTIEGLAYPKSAFESATQLLERTEPSVGNGPVNKTGTPLIR